MAAAFLSIVLAILLGILTLVSVVFTIINFANSGKNRFIWLFIFIGALLGMIFSVYFGVNTAVKRVKTFTEKLRVPYGINDSTASKEYNLADSLNSKQIQYLKLIEPKDLRDKVPQQFYNYLGFRDYYRMPLRYPFSLHCEDMLMNASLFNEQNVSKFNKNDNGEEDCKVYNIVEFTFDENILLAKQTLNPGANETCSYLIYHFSSGNTEEIKKQEDLIIRAKELQFSRPIKFFTCKEYYDLF